jgi:hypothetical protein
MKKLDGHALNVVAQSVFIKAIAIIAVKNTSNTIAGSIH